MDRIRVAQAKTGRRPQRVGLCVVATWRWRKL